MVERQEQYSRRNCILIHGVKENQNEDTDELVVNKTKSEIDLEISSRDNTDCTHRIYVLNKDKNRPIIIKFVRYMDRRRDLPTKRD